MKVVKERLFKPLNRAKIGREVEDELRLHLELLTEEHLQIDLPLAEARAAAVKRFGDVERIKDQCVEISRRSHPSSRALKFFLTMIFLVGVLVRVFSPEYHLTRAGDILIAVSILSHLLLYVRGLNPSSFLSRSETSSPLKLNDNGQTTIVAYDQRKRSPVERFISDK